MEDKHAAKLSDRLLEIGRDCSTRLKEPFRSADHAIFSMMRKACRNDSRHFGPNRHSPL
jgi:hypothetical protein